MVAAPPRGTVQASTLGGSKSLRVAEYSLLSPMRDFHGDCPGHCRLFFGFARDLIDSKARLRAPAECRTSLVIGVQQIRGVRSTEPMSRGGNDPAAVERLKAVPPSIRSAYSGCRDQRLPFNERLWHRTARLSRRRSRRRNTGHWGCRCCLRPRRGSSRGRQPRVRPCRSGSSHATFRCSG